jgi:ATP-dependent exoDNAse (exonuclease V) beta subunit
VDLDPVLAAEHLDAQERSGFESLCRLYVAMTRAERGLYLIANRLPKSDGSITEAKLLRSVLGLPTSEPGNKQERAAFSLRDAEDLHGVEVHWAHEIGDRTWYQSFSLREHTATQHSTQPEPLGQVLRQHQPLARRRTPSGEESFKVKGKALFGVGRDVGRETGTLVHELLSHVAWVDELYDEAEQMQIWQEQGLTAHAAFERALPHARRAISSGAFDRPRGELKLWRERPFDLVLPNHEWITGTFDRAVVGQLSAQIIDFKTDDVSSPEAEAKKVEGYKPQLLLYRTAVSRLTGLAESAISCTLVFTRKERNACVPVAL